METPTPKTLSDDDLISTLTTLFSEERKLETLILRHIREVEDRQLHLKRGYSNLVSYLVQEFKLSEGSAVRRIQAMRLLKDVPQVEVAIKTGAVSITNASMLQTFFRAERKENRKVYTPQEKTELFGKIENKTTRECERILKAISPEAMRRKDRQRVVSADEVEITCRVPQAVAQKLTRIKNLFSHKCPNATYAELLEAMADIVLKQIDPIEKEDRKTTAPVARCEVNENSRRIPQALRQKMWKRAEGRCEFVDPRTKKRCESRYRLEIHHHEPFSCGGKTEERNLSIVCKSHNMLAAVESYGRDKMSAHFPFS